MGLIENTLDGRIDRVAMAIDRIRTYDPIANGFMDKPYYVAYSGGKDSDALRILFEMAGVKYDLVHNLTTVDAPETVYYVRSIPMITINKPKETMWRLIMKKKMPPTRLARYCCEVLKEHGGTGRLVATGVRWDESTARKTNRGVVEVQHNNRHKSLILNSDNDENRKLFENCQMKGKRILNPIIDWSTEDIWELLCYAGCASNPLYQCGYTRVGCIGCPMAGSKGMKKDFLRYPTYERAYIRAFDRMLLARKEAGLITDATWESGKAVFNWWLNDKKREAVDPNQMTWDALDGVNAYE